MSKKKRVLISSSATIKCPHCSKNSRISLFDDTYIGNLVCKKCKQNIETPPAHCCVVCAFSKKKCPQSLILEAKMKNLEIKYQSARSKTKLVNPETIPAGAEQIRNASLSES